MQQRTRTFQQKSDMLRCIHCIRKGIGAKRDDMQGNEREEGGTTISIGLKKRSGEVK